MKYDFRKILSLGLLMSITALGAGCDDEPDYVASGAIIGTFYQADGSTSARLSNVNFHMTFRVGDGQIYDSNALGGFLTTINGNVAVGSGGLGFNTTFSKLEIIKLTADVTDADGNYFEAVEAVKRQVAPNGDVIEEGILLSYDSDTWEATLTADFILPTTPSARVANTQSRPMVNLLGRAKEFRSESTYTGSKLKPDTALINGVSSSTAGSAKL